MQKWLLPTLSEVLACESPGIKASGSQLEQTREIENGYRRAIHRMAKEQLKAEREWSAAMAATEQLLLQVIEASQFTPVENDCKGSVTIATAPTQGLVLAGPVPVLSHPAVIAHFKTGIFTAGEFNPLAFLPFQLPPATDKKIPLSTNESSQLTLLPADPLAREQFCLVLTADFSLVMVLGEQPDGTPAFLFSFEPEVIEQAWHSLRGRVMLGSPHQICQLDTLVEQFPPTAPNYRTVMQFSRQLLKHIPEGTAEHGTREAEEQVSTHLSKLRTQNSDNTQNSQLKTAPACSTAASLTEPLRYQHLELKTQNSKLKTPISPQTAKSTIQNLKSDDVELLQAFAHEVRTPLTTIRTLIRLLLKRRDLAPDIVKRLEIIDHECTEQIDRMELIFRAVELETAPVKQTPVNLTPISLGQVLQHSIPRWQKQASRRNLTLDVALPQKLPTVVSNPVMLDQVLTGLIENFTRNVPSGGHIQVEVTPAGDQLKLQLQSLPLADDANPWKTGEKNPPVRKSIGQLLMFQPETGNISLNLDVTKNLFQALGGKLIVRQRPQQGEVMTIFLPLS